MTEKRHTALVAMSGGVDSSAAALVLKQRGYEITGCTMKLLKDQNADEADDARTVCESLGAPHYVCDYIDEFNRCVIKKFIESYENGLTPNPCIECNRSMKFGALFEYADELGIYFVATGHYARIEERDGLFVLKKAKDINKDQSYVLCSLTQDKLSRIVFPLGDMDKQAVRSLTEEHGFINAHRKESQDICFVPDGDYASGIEKRTGKTYPEGDFIDTHGNVLGRHRGLIRYTVGQRRGLGISAEAPYYVQRLDIEKNAVILGSDEELFTREVKAENFNWISGKAPTDQIRCNAKIRYRQSEQPATVTTQSEDTVTVIFDSPQRAVTPGQMLVLYDGDIVLGGGVIT